MKLTPNIPEISTRADPGLSCFSCPDSILFRIFSLGDFVIGVFFFDLPFDLRSLGFVLFGHLINCHLALSVPFFFIQFSTERPSRGVGSGFELKGTSNLFGLLVNFSSKLIVNFGFFGELVVFDFF